MKNLKPFKAVNLNESLANEKDFKTEVLSMLELYNEPGGGYFLNDAEAEQFIKKIFEYVQKNTKSNLRSYSLN